MLESTVGRTAWDAISENFFGVLILSLSGIWAVERMWSSWCESDAAKCEILSQKQIALCKIDAAIEDEDEN